MFSLFQTGHISSKTISLEFLRNFILAHFRDNSAIMSKETMETYIMTGNKSSCSETWL